MGDAPKEAAIIRCRPGRRRGWCAHATHMLSARRSGNAKRSGRPRWV